MGNWWSTHGLACDQDRPGVAVRPARGDGINLFELGSGREPIHGGTCPASIHSRAVIDVRDDNPTASRRFRRQPVQPIWL